MKIHGPCSQAFTVKWGDMYIYLSICLSIIYFTTIQCANTVIDSTLEELVRIFYYFA